MENRVIRIDSSRGKRLQAVRQSSALVHYSKHYGMELWAEDVLNIVSWQERGCLFGYV